MAETDEPTRSPIVEEPSRAELLGSNNWEGLLHPLNLSLRRLILLSGDFCQCTNDSFKGDKFSKLPAAAATVRNPSSMTSSSKPPTTTRSPPEVLLKKGYGM